MQRVRRWAPMATYSGFVTVVVVLLKRFGL